MNIHKEITKKILVLDGAMGSLIQREELTEKDYRGRRFANHHLPLKGNNDILSLTHPALIRHIHADYLRAGADIIETNTLNANRISQEDYGLTQTIYEMNRSAATLAREEADHFSNSTSPRFVAGSIGPTGKTASLPPDMDQPAYRDVDFDRLNNAYREQIQGLLDGGADLLLIETVFDLINCKAAYFAARECFRERGISIPVMISITIAPENGRILSGHTVRSFYNAFSSQDIFSLGLNCSSGSRRLVPHLKELGNYSRFYASIYPNAGLPDENGEYTETPDAMTRYLEELLAEGSVNIVGGCCGTTPDHIRGISELSRRHAPRRPPSPASFLHLSGLDHLDIGPDSNFINIGERTNVAGSRRFARLIKKKKYPAALEVAARQIRKGARIIDVNMDDPMIDAVQEVATFLNLVNSEPEISRVPVMLDSSRWEVIEAGLKRLSGKGIVNSISLKNGEEDFLKKAEKIRQYGAAVTVMAFDEKGQAVEYDHKIQVCQRAYRLLTEKLHFPPGDIIFDPNILTIGTGIAEHRDYARGFIRAVSWIKKNLPGCRVSGGISNLSFAFRGNNHLREAMHSVFLYHAIHAGLDMGIVNASKLMVYEDIHEDLRRSLEDLILNRDPDATQRVLQMSQQMADREDEREEGKQTETWRSKPVEKRIQHALVKGITTFVERDCREVLQTEEDAVDFIQGPVMEAVYRVGELFNQGKMFLPQVVKTARVMKMVVENLLPDAGEEAGKGPSAGRILLATVKGDVHDIGKNIVGTILGCNNYEIIDVGVSIPPDRIIQTAREKKADIIGLSGLITPSLQEMITVVKEMKSAGLYIPVILGGATTSRIHTALKIAPQVDFPVIHARDASAGIQIIHAIMNPEERKTFLSGIREEYEKIREERSKSAPENQPLSFVMVQKKHPDYFPPGDPVPAPSYLGARQISSVEPATLDPYIQWDAFFHPWGFRGTTPEVLKKEPGGNEARKLYDDAQQILEDMTQRRQPVCDALVGFYPAFSDRDNRIHILSPNPPRHPLLSLPFLRRQQGKSPEDYLCLSDWIRPRDNSGPDYIGIFVLSCNRGTRDLLHSPPYRKNEYRSLIVRELIHRLTEAFSEWLHRHVRRELWGYTPEESLSPEDLFRNRQQGIRPTPGYSCLPDHSVKQDIFRLMEVEERLSLDLTENHMIQPPASLAGFYFSHPDSRYFSIPSISRKQYRHYLKYRSEPEEEILKSLHHLIR